MLLYLTFMSSVTMSLCFHYVDLSTMVADVMHPDLGPLQRCIEDFMDTVDVPPLRIGTMVAFFFKI